MKTHIIMGINPIGNPNYESIDNCKPPVNNIVNCRITKATREPLYGYGIDWIIEEKTNVFLGSIGRSEQTDKYPYNKIFEIKEINKKGEDTMEMMRAGFSINQYDKDGDCWDSGIFIHVSDSTILKFGNLDELEHFAKCLVEKAIPEIKETIKL